MAEYRVVKDGVEIKIMKSLTAAKKAADSKGAEVFLGDERVYTAQAAEPVEQTAENESGEKAPAVKKYRLKALMNIREKPDMAGRILSTMKTGTVVTVRGITDDWMKIEYGTGNAYVLYGAGKFAEELR